MSAVHPLPRGGGLAALHGNEAANGPQVVTLINSARFVTIELASTITGLSEGAVRKRIERGIWLEGHQWRRAADGRIWIDMKGVEQWVLQETA